MSLRAAESDKNHARRMQENEECDKIKNNHSSMYTGINLIMAASDLRTKKETVRTVRKYKG